MFTCAYQVFAGTLSGSQEWFRDLWHLLLSTLELTLNSMRRWTPDPTKSARTGMYGYPFDFYAHWVCTLPPHPVPVTPAPVAASAVPPENVPSDFREPNFFLDHTSSDFFGPSFSTDDPWDRIEESLDTIIRDTLVLQEMAFPDVAFFLLQERGC